MPASLPVDDCIPEIKDRLHQTNNLVLVAPPGAGKTTRVPPALLDIACGEILVVEPRRLAARLAARRVARELAQPLGKLVGYQVRFEEICGPSTRLRYLTGGILLRRLLSDPLLEGVGCVILDEFHERHLDTDLCAALARRLQQRARPDLRMIVMSATLDAEPVAEFFGRCPVVRSSGRQYEVAISYTPSSPAPLADQVAEALHRLLWEGLDGDVLVFLPGAAEIRQAAKACAALAEKAGMLMLPLHGDLPPEEQDRAVAPAPQRKLILSTNVAESSVTIEGVTAVIDSGLARVASVSPWSGLPQLSIRRISRASADQRAGRAGRTAPGRVIRLYPEADYLRRAAQDPPEILRQDLSEMLLQLAAMEVDPAQLAWLTPPPEAALAAAADLLRRLGALDSDGQLTREGREMAAYPLPPRLAMLVVASDRRGSPRTGRGVAALLSAGQRLSGREATTGESDLEALLATQWSPLARRIYRQICAGKPPRSQRESEEGFRTAVLAAFPDRVARRRSGDELLLAGGGSAVLSRDSVVRRADWLVAVDIEDRRERGLPLVRLASAIRPEWLLDLFPERVEESAALEWNRNSERVEAVSTLRFEGLVLTEFRGAPADFDAASALLAEKAWEAGLHRFTPPEELDELMARVSFAAEHSPVPPLTEEHLRRALRSLCQGRRSFAELEQAAAAGGFRRALLDQLPPESAHLLSEIAPERIRLPSGRQLRVRYARGRPPWVASRLQDFFGLHETPRIASGKVPVTVHLLAPNQQPVQTTTDLAGFWQRLYPQVRRELNRRYPRHPWPERPV